MEKTDTKTDTRTFPEIWAALNKDEREEVTYRLMTDRCAMTRQTVWNWASGKTQPWSPLVKRTIASTVGKVIGAKVLPVTLFPSR